MCYNIVMEREISKIKYILKIIIYHTLTFVFTTGIGITGLTLTILLDPSYLSLSILQLSAFICFNIIIFAEIEEYRDRPPFIKFKKSKRQLAKEEENRIMWRKETEEWNKILQDIRDNYKDGERIDGNR